MWATRNGSDNCNEAAVKIEMNFGGVGASIKTTIDGVIDTINAKLTSKSNSNSKSKSKSNSKSK